MHRSRKIVLGAAIAATPLISHAQVQGPSTLQTPYVLPAFPGIQTISIATNGNGSAAAPDELHPRVGGGTYRMVGIPDGLGAYDNGDGSSFTIVMNHELGANQGVIRAHGSVGSFVSKWNINKATLAVNTGQDLITSVVGGAAGAAPFGRFCSGDLATQGAYFNPASGLGTNARLFQHGEEVGNDGRVFATDTSTGTAYHLPHLGRFSWENSVASPFAQDKTVVVGTDDSTPGQVYVYVGNKTNSGNVVDRAGLTNGELYGVQVSGAAVESRGSGIGANSKSFAMHNFGDVSGMTGGALDAASIANNVTNFLRPEDGAWDPRPGKENDFYFVTTDRFNSLTNPGTPAGQDGRSRLWRMRFNDITNPSAGGVVDKLLEGNEGGEMFDNLCVDSHGRILIQEDPGNQAHLAKIWLYDIDGANYGVIATHDPARFGGPSAPFTQDEESSGIIDARDILGDGWFLMDVQAHYNINTPGLEELVQGGQLLAMYVPTDIVPEPSSLALLAFAALPALRRRRR